VPHSPYRPDIAPSDFSLFGYLKEKLRRTSFTASDDLVFGILQIVSEKLENGSDNCVYILDHETGLRDEQRWRILPQNFSVGQGVDRATYFIKQGWTSWASFTVTEMTNECAIQKLWK
jgi:hypothetical protein